LFEQALAISASATMSVVRFMGSVVRTALG
jgi:hypothetical protein